MAKHIWSVLCSKGALDTQTNQISLLDVLEQASATLPAEPTSEESLHLPCQLIGLWARADPAKPEKAQCAVHLDLPDGTATDRAVMDIDLSTTTRFRSTFRMEGIPLQNGSLEFVVEHRPSADSDWAEVARIPMELNLTVEPSEKRAVTSD